MLSCLDLLVVQNNASMFSQDLIADVEICSVDFTVILTSTTAHMITKQKLQRKSGKRIQLLWLKKSREYKLTYLVKRLTSFVFILKYPRKTLKSRCMAIFL